MGKKKTSKKPSAAPKDPLQEQIARLPKDVQDKLKSIKVKIDKFQKQVLDKFGQYIMGITILPPKQQMFPQGIPGDLPPAGAPPMAPPGMAPPMMQPMPGMAPMPPPQGLPPQAQPKKENKDEISVLVLVDDSDSKRMTKLELKDKLTKIIAEIGQSVDKNMAPQTIILSELWQNVYDQKYELLQMIAMGAPSYDKGMLQAIKIAEIHKSMVLKKFEKYIVSYVLAGSLTQGRATPTSDIDVWVVIDDTDVKKMTRAELKDKLRAIIIGMGMEAGELTGIRNKLNIQVYILTDFWDSLKEANPVIFTLLRDGVPFYDRGIFMPWKQLLKLGKIKPSPEAIDMFLGSGEQVIRRVRSKLNEIGMEDVYYALLTPSQAAIMMYGFPPPTPRETPQVLRDIFVKKEKLLEDKWPKVLEHNVMIRKKLEHGELKEVSGKEIDDLLTQGEKYLKRIKRLFSQIEKMREEKDMVHIYDTTATMMRDILRIEEVEKVPEQHLIQTFEDELISTGKIPSKFLRNINDIIKAKNDYDASKLTKVEVDQVKKESSELIKFLVEYIQRKRGRELEKAKIRVKYGDKYGEVLLLGEEAFIIHDLDAENKQISKSALTKEGGLTTTDKSSYEEMEKALAALKPNQSVFIKGKIFEDLHKVFGKEVSVQVKF